MLRAASKFIGRKTGGMQGSLTGGSLLHVSVCTDIDSCGICCPVAQPRQRSHSVLSLFPFIITGFPYLGIEGKLWRTLLYLLC